ncbi:hypothetical protein BDR04DRAFT_1093239 [Suillus decipiens]|nr:hypothetical protein BDR04DRAFT_1093239 [Suillus decipiens]
MINKQQPVQQTDHVLAESGVAPSAWPKKQQRRDHALPESGIWPWHHQRGPRSNKDEITHFLRAGHGPGHGRGTISVAQEAIKTRSRTK